MKFQTSFQTSGFTDSESRSSECKFRSSECSVTCGIVCQLSSCDTCPLEHWLHGGEMYASEFKLGSNTLDLE